MFELSQSIVNFPEPRPLALLSPLLAQQPSPGAVPALPSSFTLPGLSAEQSTLVFGIISNLAAALLILILGWIVAAIVASVVRNLLKRTDFDNRLASWTMGHREEGINVERLVASIVFWIIMVLAVVAALNVLNLTTVSQPLNTFLTEIFVFLPRLGSAAILVFIAWLLATVSKALVVRLSRSLGLDQTLAQTSGETVPERQFLLSETLGNVLYWFIFLFFLPLILDVLGLQGPLQPVQNLLNDILAALPQILKAVLIAAVGWLLARIVRDLVTNLLAASGADQVGARFGLSQSRKGSLSWLSGTIIYILILIPTAIAALEAIQIRAISAPAVAMLNQILGAVPQILTAALILIAAYVIGQFVSELVTNLLTGIGFNNVLGWLGIQSVHRPSESDVTSPGSESAAGSSAGLPRRSPSEIVGLVVLVGIMLFASVAATNVLNFQALTTIVSGVLVILGQILVGLIVFAVGLYLANLAFNLITSSGTPQSRILGQVARIAILVLVSAMALQQIGIAPNIVNLAFGFILGAIAIAIALSFGLGGRDIAAEQLREWLNSFKQGRPPRY